MKAPQRPATLKNRLDSSFETENSDDFNFAVIDPGCSGGFAWYDSNKMSIAAGIDVICKSMPETEGDIINLIKELFCAGVTEIWMEEIVGFIPMAAPGAMFTFGKNYGFIKGVIMALGIRLITVKPKVWQKALALGDKKSYGKDWKNHLKSRAQELFPNTHITLKTSDALLLLEYVKKYGH